MKSTALKSSMKQLGVSNEAKFVPYFQKAIYILWEHQHSRDREIRGKPYEKDIDRDR